VYVINILNVELVSVIDYCPTPLDSSDTSVGNSHLPGAKRKWGIILESRLPPSYGLGLKFVFLLLFSVLLNSEPY